MSKKRTVLPWGGVLAVFRRHTHVTLCCCFPFPHSVLEKHCLETTGPEGLRANLPGCFAVGSQILPDPQVAMGSLPSSASPLLTLPLSLSQ